MRKRLPVGCGCARHLHGSALNLHAHDCGDGMTSDGRHSINARTTLLARTISPRARRRMPGSTSARVDHLARLDPIAWRTAPPLWPTDLAMRESASSSTPRPGETVSPV